MVTSPDATVLVVDDTLGNLAAAGFFLEGLCSTAAALTGQEALELALKLQPDGILLDVIMPGMSGIDVPKQLQSNPITKSIAVLLVTSLSNPDSKLEGFACRAVDFVTKTFLAEELRARVATQLRIRHLQHELRQQIRSLNVELSEGRQNFDFLAQHTSSCLLCLDAWMPGCLDAWMPGCLDAWDRIVLINPAWRTISGRDPDDALGQLFSHLFLPADQEFVRKEIRLALAQRQVHVNFLARVQAVNREKTGFISASFPRTHHNSNYHWCALLTDVTQLAQEKDKWKAAHERLQGHYAACWEDLSSHCLPLDQLLNEVELAYLKAPAQSTKTLQTICIKALLH